MDNPVSGAPVAPTRTPRPDASDAPSPRALPPAVVEPLEPELLCELRDRMLHAVDLPMVLTDAHPDAHVLWCNEAFTRVTGWAAEEIVGRSIRVLHGPGTDLEAREALAEALLANRSVTLTLRTYRKDGVPFWNRLSVAPVADPAGGPGYWAATYVDVTDQVQHSIAQEQVIAAERRARNGLALVTQVSDLLADLDDPVILREIASLLGHEVVDWAAFFIDDEGLRPADGIDTTDDVSAARRRPPPDPLPEDTAPIPVHDPVQILLSGAAERLLELDLTVDPHGPCTTYLVEHLRERLAVERPEKVPTRVVVSAVPGRRRHLGLLVTVPRGGGGLDALDDNDRTVLHLVVRRVGMAIDNVRLYVREHRVAETLQRAMLPQQADIADLDVWTYYAPSSGHAQVGGDWYDVVQVSPEHVVLVIGDVVGHDVEAAAAMGQLRSVVLSSVYDGSDPGSVLDRVDHLVDGMRIPRSASLVLASLRRTEGENDGAWRLQFSRAGHLPPLLVRDGVVTTLNGATGSLIGFGHMPRTTAEADLEPGDLVILYTDGLIERRDRRLRDGLTALEEVAAELGAQDAAGVGEELLNRLADHPEDDVAVVVVRVPDPAADRAEGPGAPRRRRWSLPSEPSSIGKARHVVLRACEAWGIPGGSSAELVVSELVANAVLHGWGHLELRLFDTGDGLRIEVEDSNPAPPVATDGHPGRVGGFGMRIVERLADWGWRPSGQGKLVWARVRPASIGSALQRDTD